MDSQSEHWTQQMYECVFRKAMNGYYNFCVDGGAEFGQLVVLGSLFTEPVAGEAVPGSIILEINSVLVSGMTQSDVIGLIEETVTHLTLTLLRPSTMLNSDIRQFLCQNYTSGGPDELLQNSIRRNLYRRTTPITTCPYIPPDAGVFLPVDFQEFYRMEEEGLLLEVGYLQGHYFATPKPQKSSTSSNSIPQTSAALTAEPLFRRSQTNSSGENKNPQVLRERLAQNNFTSQPPSQRSSTHLLTHPHLRNAEHFGVAGCDLNDIVLRHYAVWLEKGSDGFGLKILSVNDVDGVFTKINEPIDGGQPLLQLRSIIPESPAFYSGIMKPGDVFIRVDDTEVRHIAHVEIKNKLDSLDVGQVVKFVMARAVAKDDAYQSLSIEAFDRIRDLRQDAKSEPKPLGPSHSSMSRRTKSSDRFSLTNRRSSEKRPLTELENRPPTEYEATSNRVNYISMGVIQHDPKRDCSSRSLDIPDSTVGSLSGENRNRLERVATAPEMRETVQDYSELGQKTHVCRRSANGFELTLLPVFLSAREKLHSLLVLKAAPEYGLETGHVVMTVNQVHVSKLSVMELLPLMSHWFERDQLLLSVRHFADCERIPDKLLRLQHLVQREFDARGAQNMFYTTLVCTKPIGFSIVVDELRANSPLQITDTLCETGPSAKSVCQAGDSIFSINGVYIPVLDQETIRTQLKQSKEQLYIGIVRECA